MTRNTPGVIPLFKAGKQKAIAARLAKIAPAPATPLPASSKPVTKKPRKPKTLAKFDADRHFWSHVDRSAGPDACHLWTGAVDPGNGYGRLWNIEGMPYAHRKAWEVANGRKVPGGKYILHARGCTSKLCCHPDHLRLGDQQENMDDAKAAGRCRSRKLSGVKAIEIRDLRAADRKRWTYAALAKKYSVSHQSIIRVLKGQTYAKDTGIGLRAGFVVEMQGNLALEQEAVV